MDLGDINGFYDSKLKPVINELESERKSIKKKLIYYLILPIVILVSLSLLLAINTGQIQILVVVFIVSIVIVAIVINKMTDPYVDKFKIKVISKLLEFVDRDLEYDHNSYIDEMDDRYRRRP
ncbi:MAG: hypothetical protein ACOC2J_01960 [bacterium]